MLTYVSQMLLNFRSRAQGYLMSFCHLNVSPPRLSKACSSLSAKAGMVGVYQSSA